MNCIENVFSSSRAGGKHHVFTFTEEQDVDCTTWKPFSAIITAFVLFILAALATPFSTVIPLGVLIFKTACILTGSTLCLYALFKLVTQIDVPAFSSFRTMTSYRPSGKIKYVPHPRKTNVDHDAKRGNPPPKVSGQTGYGANGNNDRQRAGGQAGYGIFQPNSNISGKNVLTGKGFQGGWRNGK